MSERLNQAQQFEEPVEEQEEVEISAVIKRALDQSDIRYFTDLIRIASALPDDAAKSYLDNINEESKKMLGFSMEQHFMLFKNEYPIRLSDKYREIAKWKFDLCDIKAISENHLLCSDYRKTWISELQPNNKIVNSKVWNSPVTAGSGIAYFGMMPDGTRILNRDESLCLSTQPDRYYANYKKNNRSYYTADNKIIALDNDGNVLSLKKTESDSLSVEVLLENVRLISAISDGTIAYLTENEIYILDGKKKVKVMDLQENLYEMDLVSKDLIFFRFSNDSNVIYEREGDTFVRRFGFNGDGKDPAHGRSRIFPMADGSVFYINNLSNKLFLLRRVGKEQWEGGVVFKLGLLDEIAYLDVLPNGKIFIVDHKQTLHLLEGVPANKKKKSVKKEVFTKPSEDFKIRFPRF